MRVLLIVLMTASGIVLDSPASASGACTCARRDYQEITESADSIFTGTAVASRPGNFYTFAVDAVYHGDGKPPGRISVASMGSSSMCGYEFRRGSRYLVLAHKREGRLETGLCSGNKQLTSTRGALIEKPVPTGAPTPLAPEIVKALGPAATPPTATKPAEEDPAFSGLHAVLIGGSILILAAFWRVDRRRRSPTE